MKKIITLLLFTCFLGQVYAQNEPKTLIQRALDSIPKEYKDSRATERAMMSELFKRLDSQTSYPSGKSESASLTGFNWQAAVINGVTDFIIQRAKDEVLASLLVDLQKFFNAEDGKCTPVNPEIIKVLKASFPNIAALVNNTVVYDKNVLMMLQKAFTEDLNNEVPKQAAQLVDQYLERRKVESDHRILSKYMIERIFAMLSGANPYLVLAQMKDNLPAISNEKMKSCFYILGILASEQYYLNSTQNLELNTDVSDLSSLLSFQPIYEKFHQILEEEVNNNKKIVHVDLSRSAILELAQGLKNLGEDIQSLRGKNDSAYRLGYIKVLNSLLDLFKSLEYFEPGLSSKWERSLIGVKKIVELQQSILSKDYRKSILHFTKILDSSILDSKTVRFLSFAATMAEVKSSEEVVAAIESFASPIGSFRTKRIEERPRAYSTINAYVGYAAGREWLIDKTVANSRLAAGYHGYYTPVGFEFGTALKNKVVSSFGLFISPIDLGTMTSYRMGQNSWDSLTVNNQEKINFRSVLAPSAALVFGISKTKPITFALGYQFSPEQRVLSNTVLNTNANVNVHRLFATLTLDLTLLRL